MLLQLRNSTYHFRSKIPHDLVDLLGRREIKKSLRTGSKREAKKLSRIHAAEAESMFAKLRLGKETMNDRQLKRLADKLLADILDRTEKARQHGAEALELSLGDWPEGYDFGNGMSYAGLHTLDATLSRQRTAEGLDVASATLKRRVDELRNELRLGNYSEHTRQITRRRAEADNIPTPPASWFLPPWAEQVIEEDDGVPIDQFPEEVRAKVLRKAKKLQEPPASTWDERPPAEFAAVLRTVAQTLLEGYEIELERINGDYGTARQVKAETRIMQAAKSFTLNDLWGSFKGLKTTEEAWAATTGDKYEGFVAAVNRTLGDDYDFSAFEDVDEVTKLIGKLKEYKSTRTRKKWSQASVNDCTGFLSTLYRFAIRNRKFSITYNPFEARQIAETDSKPREAFTPDELKLIWAYLQALKPKDADKYWVLLLMLYTGARIGEVCQLRLDDFEKIGEHWVVHYRSRPELGQKIKGEKRKKKKRPTEAVDRLTAIHPDLRKLGLFRYIDRLKEAGEVQLFPEEYPLPTDGRWGVLMAKKVKTFFKACLGKETNKSAHYCRHTLISWFKGNTNLTHTEASLISYMVGHEDDQINGGNKITWGTYGGPHTVNQMFGIIKKLDYGFLSPALPTGDLEEASTGEN